MRVVPDEETPFAPAAIRNAIVEAGFTMARMEITASGEIERAGDRSTFRVPGWERPVAIAEDSSVKLEVGRARLTGEVRFREDGDGFVLAVEETR